MSFENRDYYRDTDEQGGMGFGRMANASVVWWLIGINVAVFVLDHFIGMAAGRKWLEAIGNYNIAQAIYGGQIWRFASYEFLHGGLGHIFFNMLGLYFFGPLIERWWGSRRFLAFYLICGVGGSILMSLMGFVGILDVGPNTILVGASGSLFGILVAAAVLYPDMRVQMLFPPIPISMRAMALIFLGIALFVSFGGGENAGGQAAHLGGALFGYLLVKRPRSLDWADRLSMGGVTKKSREARQVYRKQKTENFDIEVDQILDKVRDHGLQSLTKREKKILQQATDRQRKNVG
ncbi:Rhomboid protease GluP [Poriferisphaera corsica]|uniref:Rhomboid protease GluP n=1 Tax=Poriferisphaera corsica TaxID=2528020 RepID=A0A517YX43_9BACT|nr:rhomboid family intramembrane serine protease [Poriferisphaera corsica]QDU34777.1 Rhomboid protease GluP [Poriferisphaera corsica]